MSTFDDSKEKNQKFPKDIPQCSRKIKNIFYFGCNCRCISNYFYSKLYECHKTDLQSLFIQIL